MFTISVTPRLKEIIESLVTWARIIAIASFISIPFDFYASVKDNEIWTGIINLAVTLALNIYLINFSTKVKRGLEATNQFEFNDGISDLKKYFRLVGIFIILLTAAAVLMMFWVLTTDASRGFGF